MKTPGQFVPASFFGSAGIILDADALHSGRERNNAADRVKMKQVGSLVGWLYARLISSERERDCNGKRYSVTPAQ